MPQIEILQQIESVGRANGVDDLIWLDREQVRHLEPEIRCVGALLSPSTGIVDSHAYLLSLLGEAEAAGAVIAYATSVNEMAIGDDRIAIFVNGDSEPSLRAKIVVNAAGLGAINLAKAIADFPVEQIPSAWTAKGNYFTFHGRQPFNRLIYPVPEPGQALELDYFRTLDIEADRALQLLLNPNPSRLDSTMRVAWARYVVSLNSRAPKEVSELAEQIAEMSKREVAFRREPATPQLAPEQMLIRCTDSDGVASKILKMQWSCVRLFESDIELLSTDRPVIWPVSLDRPEAYMVLPIAPQLLFVAANSKQTILFYAGMQHKHLIKSINKITVGQARQFVWASNDKELDFVEKYLLGGSETNFVRTE